MSGSARAAGAARPPGRPATDTSSLKHSIAEEKRNEDEPADYERAISVCGYGKFHHLLTLAFLPMVSSQLFVTGGLAYALPEADCDLKLSDFQKGTLNSGVYAGNIVAGLIWGALSDKFGRRNLMLWGFVVDFLLGVGSSFAHKYWLLLILKVLSGIVISGPNSLMMAYVAEIFSKEDRRSVLMWIGMFVAMSGILQPAMAYLVIPLQFRVVLVPGQPGLVLSSWRVFLLLSTLPSLLAAASMLLLPESPKFLMSKGRHDEALRVFQRIHAANTGSTDYPIKSLLCPEREEVSASKGNERSWRDGLEQFRLIGRRPYATTLLLFVVIQFGTMLSINSIRLWTPQLFALLDQYERLEQRPAGAGAGTVCSKISAVLEHQQHQHQQLQRQHCLPIGANVYMRSIIIGAAATGSFLVTTPLAKKAGRRVVYLACYPLSAAFAVALVWAWDANSLVAFISVFTAVTANALNATAATQVDLFPTSIRATAVSVIIAVGRMASLLGNSLLPVILSISCQAVFFYIAGCLVACSFMSYLLPKSKEVS